MKCHYEVLDVEQDATVEEITKAYRKLALRYHPDKNPEHVEEYTKIFHDLQKAYAVLSDLQERAWYDKHREAILRGGDDYVDDSIDLMKYFDSDIYSGYGDDEGSFYCVYEKLFCSLAEEEEPYINDDIDFPLFGNSTSSYDDVVQPFYSFWQSFCTAKTFVWVEEYDVRSAPNRPTQRAMEKENRKARDTAKKKRNEEVRELVAFVRKRDKRVKEHAKRLKEKQQDQKIAFEKRRAEQIKENNVRLANYKEQDWMSFDNMQHQLAEIEAHFDNQFNTTGGGTSDNSDDDNIVSDYCCIACDKRFKSEKAFANHEKSKKHKENVELIKREMEAELNANDALQLDFDPTRENQDDDSLNKQFEDEGTESVEDGRTCEIVNSEESTEVNINPDLDYEVTGEVHKVGMPTRSESVTSDDGIRDLRSEIENTTRKVSITSLSSETSITCGDSSCEELHGISVGQLGFHCDSIHLPDMEAKRKLMGQKIKKRSAKKDESDSDGEYGPFLPKNYNGHLGVSAKDSLNLPRRATSKKHELKDKQEKKRAATIAGLMIDDVFVDATLGDSAIMDSLKVNRKRSKKHKKKGKNALPEIEESNSSESDDGPEGFVEEDEDEVDLETPNCNDSEKSTEHPILQTTDNLLEVKVEINDEQKESPKQDVGGNEQKSHKKSKTFKGMFKNFKSKSLDDDEGHSCNTCQERFSSRNKLFEHIKISGHALKVEGEKAHVSDKRTKKAKKNKKK